MKHYPEIKLFEIFFSINSETPLILDFGEMDILRQKTSVVSKLRVKGEGLDAVAARLQFERLFGATDFLSEGLPPKAIICIKNLRDPAPRTLPLNRLDLRYSAAWRNSVAREIEKLFRRAFRPIRESIPARAESVVFEDSAELLACLASDWRDGLLTEHWWWRSLFPNLQQAQTVARIWIESAEFVPTAMQILAKQGKVIKFVAKLQPDETIGLLRRIMQVFGLNNLQKALFESFDKKEKLSAPAAKGLFESRDLRFEKKFSASFQRLAPWSPTVAETQAPALSFAAQSLLGIGLMLVRSPRIARSTEFARQVKMWRKEVETGRKITLQSKKETRILAEKQAKKRLEKIERVSFLTEEEEFQKTAPRLKISSEKTLEKPTVKISETAPRFEESAAKPSDYPIGSECETFPPKAKAAEKAKKIIFDAVRTEKTFEPEIIKSKTKSRQAEKTARLQKISPEIFEDTETQFEFIVETRFGGVFYLLNLGLYLNLYRDFTETSADEVDLNIWDFVALLGLEFLGKKIKKDEIWELLKRLAGRESEKELGQGFKPSDEWRIPPEWLETFPTKQKWLWTKTRKRLIIRHPEGFCVIDVRLRDDLKNQLKNELKKYGKNVSELAKSDLKKSSANSKPLTNWLKNLCEYAEKRLLQALNLQTKQQINDILFERRASVTVSATHLDVTFRLADLPFEVRLSGLDRNPGWIPAAGKFVYFHFI